MKRSLLFLLVAAAISASAQSTTERIVRNDASKYKMLKSVHAGAGEMGFTQLIGRDDLSTNFLYLHAGTINAKGGIGHHFHHGIEEMYVLLSGEAQFTVNGRTSVLKAPVIVPCKLGDAHAIYNHTGEPVKWLNFAVSRTKGQGDAFDLGDNRVGTTIDKVPVFVYSELKKEKLQSEKHPYTSNGVLYRRALSPEVFGTNWNYVDHMSIPPGKTTGPHSLGGTEEVYYVIKGSGNFLVNGLSKQVAKDDAFTALLGETVELSNNGSEDLEVLIIGVAVSKGQGSENTKAMVLQMDFVVPTENAEAFEKMYHSIYVPAMTVQQGYLGSKLLRLFSEDVAKTIQAEPTLFNYSIQISFDTEENRRKWVASDQHQIAWPAASKLAKEFKWRGYDLVGDDVRKK
ncbi:MAG TPA: cupin domain-containing protein [Cyclobacteriaceae bacterium]|nr:cupin domain-containing protein [Cyclobacteriaceae bacterium]